MKSGIYKIICLANDKIYIGSGKRILKRKSDHFTLLKKNKHINSHLQNAYNKYGKENFVFEIIEYCDIEKLIEREQYWIDTLKPEFNQNPIAGSRLGTKHSEETKIKMRKVPKPSGNKHYLFGKHRSDDVKLAVSKAKKGKPGTMLGKHHSDETKQKMKENHVDINGSKNPFYGKHHTEETKNKLRSKITKERIEKSTKGLREKSIFSENDIINIRRLRNEEHWKVKDVAKLYNCPVSTINNIIHYYTWKDVK